MAKKVSCFGCHVQFDPNEVFKCLKCEYTIVHHSRNDNRPAFYQCCNSNCWEKWAILPCPRCGTDVPASAVKGCYISTYVYGSYDCPEVWMLRRYRDDVLSKSWLGRRFISVYYATSPKLVALFGNKKWFHKVCKPYVDKLATRLRKNGIDDSPYFK